MASIATTCDKSLVVSASRAGLTAVADFLRRSEEPAQRIAAVIVNQPIDEADEAPTPSQWQEFGSLISQLRPELLNFEGVPISRPCSEAIAAIIRADALNSKAYLESLSVSSIYSTDSRLSAQAQRRLRFLTLSDCSLADPELCTIAEPLVSAANDGLSSLSILNLSNNQIGDQGAVSIADLIAKSGVLQSVVLTFNSIENAGVLAIAESLKNYSSGLTMLSINYNQYNDEAAAALVDALGPAGNLHLRMLNATYDDYDLADRAAKTLAQNEKLAKYRHWMVKALLGEPAPEPTAKRPDPQPTPPAGIVPGSAMAKLSPHLRDMFAAMVAPSAGSIFEANPAAAGIRQSEMRLERLSALQSAM
ncbi:hypothetical protein H696_04575 [Fonticula alba]|uniref:Uncharacterized protein n=1 Tax=Fonticula alba TaxID=691883 RepID=A0A058Z4V2_FONAL|nr:hypothetical protein H696_04575 [Fonticula alba]KCV69161.1 hypothetical protein H696_04575 [Fonticula alba]|eukprot:XP_009496732.1 hypothetical protein H696_04575 [Fonticula alba]